MSGSSFIIGTLRPRASRIAASEAAAMPLPSEDTTPPVTKTSGVTELGEVMGSVHPLESPILQARAPGWPVRGAARDHPGRHGGAGPGSGQARRARQDWTQPVR